MKRLAAALGAMWIGVACATLAHAADPAVESWGEDARSGVPIEVRLGILYHEDSRFQRAFGDSDKHRDGGPIDINGEILYDPYSGRFDNPFVEFFLTPAFRVGGTVNTGGGTSHANIGLAFDQYLFRTVFAEGTIGLAVHNGDHHNGGDRRPLGCNPVAFMALSAGVDITERWRFMATVEHLDNFDACDENGQLTNIGLRIGYRFN